MLLGMLQAASLSALLGDMLSASLQIATMALVVRWITQEKNSFACAWIFSTTWLVCSVWWLHIAMHVHGHLPALVSLTAIGLLCAGLGLYYAVALYIYSKYKNKLAPWQQALLLAAIWTIAELARAQWFTGFPWAAIGYAQINSVLSFAAPWVGVYGIGFVAALLAGWLANMNYEGGKKTEKKPEENKLKMYLTYERKDVVIGLIVMSALMIPVSRNKTSEYKNLRVALLQGNIPQDIKFSVGKKEALNWYQQQSLASQADLTVLPETALPYLKQDLPLDYWQELENKFNGEQQIAVIGLLTTTVDAGYANSALALGLNAEPHVYNKYHLVPFGEFTPDMFKWFTSMMSLGLGDFERGSDKPKPFKWNKHLLALNICYEDVFGEELAKRFVQGSENVPTVLVNISNIDWFGDTVVIPQHLNIARMRSLEFNRPSIRATNSGGTAIINAQGEITHQLKPFTRGVLQGEVTSVDKAITPFAYWAGHWGLKPLWLLCLALVVWLIRQSKKNQNANELLATTNVK